MLGREQEQFADAERGGMRDRRPYQPCAVAATARVRQEFENDGVTVDEVDGLTFTADDGSWWFNLRASNTEPFLRLNAEAEKPETLESLTTAVLEQIRQ